MERIFAVGVKALDAWEEYSGYKFGAGGALTYDYVIECHDLGEIQGAIRIQVELVEEIGVASSLPVSWTLKSIDHM